MAIIRRKWYKMNRNKKAATKSCKSVGSRDNTGNRKTQENRMNDGGSIDGKKTGKNENIGVGSKNGRASASHKKSRERRETEKPKRIR